MILHEQSSFPVDNKTLTSRGGKKTRKNDKELKKELSATGVKTHAKANHIPTKRSSSRGINK
jgi:hypothetical protein